MYSKLHSTYDDSMSNLEEKHWGFCTLENLRKLDTVAPISWEKHENIRESMYAEVVDRLCEISAARTMNSNTFHLATRLFAVLLSKKYDIPEGELLLYGVVCLSLASKHNEIYPCEIEEYEYACNNKYSQDKILKTEIVVYRILGGRMSYPTILDYSRMFSYQSGFSNKEHAKVLMLAKATTLSCTLQSYSLEVQALALNWLVSDDEKLPRAVTNTKNNVYACISEQIQEIKRLGSLFQTSKYMVNSFIAWKKWTESILPAKGVYYHENSVLGESLPFVDLGRVNKLKCDLGTGTYGQVNKVTLDGEVCAMKKNTNKEGNGIAQSFIREVNLYQTVSLLGRNGEYTTKCLGFYVDEKKEYIFLEYANLGSLKHFINKNPNRFVNDHNLLIKSAKRLYRGLDFLHSIGTLNRDIKPQNILVFGSHDDVELKLCDFGMARGPGVVLAGINGFSPTICTLWYRPMEVLYEHRDAKRIIYGASVDVWSMTCVLHEMVTGKPLFPGDSEIDQAFRIAKFCGVSKKVRENYGLEEEFPDWPYASADFPFRSDIKVPNVIKTIIEGGLKTHPQERITAGEAYELLEEAHGKLLSPSINSFLSFIKTQTVHTAVFGANQSQKIKRWLPGALKNSSKVPDLVFSFGYKNKYTLRLEYSDVSLTPLFLFSEEKMVDVVKDLFDTYLVPEMWSH